MKNAHLAAFLYKVVFPGRIVVWWGVITFAFYYDDGMKGRSSFSFPAEKSLPELTEKIQENLVFRSTVDFIDHKNHGFF